LQTRRGELTHRSAGASPMSRYGGCGGAANTVGQARALAVGQRRLVPPQTGPMAPRADAVARGVASPGGGPSRAVSGPVRRRQLSMNTAQARGSPAAARSRMDIVRHSHQIKA